MSSLGQPVSDARGDDLGTTTGDNRLARQCDVGHTPVPTPCPTVGLAAGTQLTAALETPGKHTLTHVVAQQGPPASPPCFSL